MNELNYASLEASKKLEDAGIVLETERFWYLSPFNKWQLSHDYDGLTDIEHCPAPSMAEVWRELTDRGYPPCSDGAFFWLCDESNILTDEITNANPTDALIYLLIWVRNGGLRGMDT